jgi:very-short-patch-repair endonuclease
MMSAHGWRLIRITWRHLHQDPEAVVADLERILARQRSSSSARVA